MLLIRNDYKMVAFETEQTLAFATHLGEGLRVTGVNFRHIGPEHRENDNIPTEKNLNCFDLKFLQIQNRLRITNHDVE
jgi:hypothetical protein